MESLKQPGTSHSSRDVLKICVKTGASWSVQAFKSNMPGSEVKQNDCVKNEFRNDMNVHLCRTENRLNKSTILIVVSF